MSNNSFTIIRLFAAILVLVSHSYPLGGLYGSEILGRITKGQFDLGGLGVTIFFSISGFLIAKSYLNTNNNLQYIYKRALRIFPGFWVCLLVTAFLFAPIIYIDKYNTVNGYFSVSPSPISFIVNNFLLKINQFNIGTLLEGLPYPYSINGSLWTLFLEFLMYIFVIIAGITGMLKNKKLFLFFFLILYIFYFNHFVPLLPDKLEPIYIKIDRYFSLFEPVLFFLSGVAFYLYRTVILYNQKIYILFIFILCFFYIYGFSKLITPFIMPYFIFALAAFLPFSFIDKYGDYSYGVYIYAFPIQQVLTYFKINQEGIILYTVLAFLLSLVCAFFSYHYVEKPFLRLKQIVPTEYNSSKQYLSIKN